MRVPRYDARMKSLQVGLLALSLLACGGKPPGVSQMRPLGGPPGTLLRVSGDGFAAGMKVTLGGEPLGDLHVDPPHGFIGRVPADLGPGEYDLEIILPNGRRTKVPRAFAVGGEASDAPAPGATGPRGARSAASTTGSAPPDARPGGE